MKVDQFDFTLPDTCIALRPAQPRDAARLLVLSGADGMIDSHVNDLPRLLKAGDLLVFNNTKVIPAQLSGTRFRGEHQANVSATLHMRVSDNEWLAFVKPAKRIAKGDRISFGHQGNLCLVGTLDASVAATREGGEALLQFDLAGAALDEALHQVGHVPLPPYISAKRPEDDRDREDYQTIYAVHEGAVAAPTAGLHFTPGLFQRLAEAGIGKEFVTLHVGAGTFLPVKAADTKDHRMHAEIGYVSEATADRINAARAAGGRIIAVGTTSLRLLESAATEDGKVRPWSGPTDIFITPGYRFRAIDGLMTNFHLPRSTLFMLVCALMGLDRMQGAYAHAVKSGYRFYSYGDASLMLP